jgi:DNA-binding MarR family transcriptional regulator
MAVEGSRPATGAPGAGPVGTGPDAALDAAPADVSLARLQHTAAAVRHHIEQVVLRADGLTWTGFAVLRLLWRLDRVETRRAAAETGIAKATLTGVVNTLAGRRLVRRQPHPTDRRLVLLELTRTGRRLAGRVVPAVLAEERYLLAGLDPARRAELDEVLRLLAERLDSPEARGRRE